MSRSTTPEVVPRAWAGLGVLVLPCLLVSMDGHVLNLALPQLAAQLRPTAVQQLWIVDGYGFFLAGTLLVMGALADRLGRRRLLLWGATAFAAASTAAAFAPTPGALIAARAGQGVAAATLMPSTLALIRVLFPDERRRRVALGVWAAAFAVGGLVAPVVAGILLERFWWGSVLLLALPAMAVLLVLGPLLLPESRAVRTPSVDVGGAALALAAVLAWVHGVKQVAGAGADPAALAAIAAGTLLGAAFVQRQARSDAPWIEPAALRRRTVLLPLAANALGFFVLYALSFLSTQYLQLVLGLTPLQAGLWTLPSSLAWLAGSAAAPALAARFGAGTALGGGVLVAAAGVAVFALPVPDARLAVVVTGSVILSIGLAPAYVLATELATSTAPPDQAGAASGLLETAAELGGALGIALLGSLGGAVYRSGLAGSAAGELPEARESLAGALSAADRLPGPAAADLALQARAAFTDGVRLAGVTGAVLLGALAVALLVLLRRAAAPGHTLVSVAAPTAARDGSPSR